MAEHDDADAARRALNAFLQPACPEMLFTWPLATPTARTGLCFCEGSWIAHLRVLLRAVYMQTACASTFTTWKRAVLRRRGMRIGRDVHIAATAWFDPSYPWLINLGDGVCIGMGARFFCHEYRRDHLRIGRIRVGTGALIGGHCLIPCGVTIGPGATVAAGAVVTGDVPAGRTVIGNPGRLVPTPPTGEPP